MVESDRKTELELLRTVEQEVREFLEFENHPEFGPESRKELKAALDDLYAFDWAMEYRKESA